VVSQATVQAAGEDPARYLFDPLGHQEMKGRATPVVAYRVAASSADKTAVMPDAEVPR
jgi:hypothetical protein